ncbi:hypothetical protein B0O99DRAFT_592495 [Bisporella sp. PMI_857]|nr:hypothetical protein B0O99DRAFT_592495 [Bisporella sp. PMI_857]
MSTYDQLRDAENQIVVLEAEIESLTRRLSRAEADAYNIDNRYQALLDDHAQCRNLRNQLHDKVGDLNRLTRKLEDERLRNDRLKDENRALRLASAGAENYRQRLDDKIREVLAMERAIKQRDDLISDRDQTISNMRGYLSQLGYTYREI